MRCFASLLLIFAISISFCSCSNSAEKTYVPPKDVTLTYTGVCGNNADIYNGIVHIIENHSEHVIKNISIVIAQFDRNGFYFDTGMVSAYLDYSSINLLPDDNIVLTNYSVDSEDIYYIRGIITKVEYMDGEVWESDAVESWLEKMKSGIDINEEKAIFKAMKELADKAEKNDYMSLELTNASMDSLTATIDYSIDVFNTKGDAISSYEILALFFDKNGFPIYTNVCTLSSNSVSGEIMNANITTPGHGKGSFEYVLIYGGKVASAKGIISEISFANGDIWKNQFAPYWELYYGDVVGK